ncbi:balbiani ring protein 3 [Phymastichus coffea]|uniref:balbiani ring protein 3 n=1 Tax=Phymastichus coffea TaxID=108790 RepID=UPI00273CDF27|nr:balbiani ring protein 3 [Phymastichus coffea]
MLLLLLLVLAFAASLHAYDRPANLSVHATSDRIFFPDQPRRLPSPDQRLLSSLDLAKRINSIESDQDFYELFQVYPTPQSYSPVLLERIAGDERSSKVIKAKPAICMPEVQVVPVVENADPSEFYFPSCVRMKRCGGCCNHELLSCQVTALETRNYEILVTKVDKYSGENIVFKKIVPLDEHTACLCDCTKKEKDCTDKQFYLKEECRCSCKNSDEEYKCQQQNEKKYWDPNSCSCHCRKVEECFTNAYFDPNSCSCKSLQLSRQWFNNERRTSYNFRQLGKPKESPPVIVTLDANDPRRKHKEDPEYK